MIGVDGGAGTMRAALTPFARRIFTTRDGGVERQGLRSGVREAHRRKGADPGLSLFAVGNVLHPERALARHGRAGHDVEALHLRIEYGLASWVRAEALETSRRRRLAHPGGRLWVQYEYRICVD